MYSPLSLNITCMYLVAKTYDLRNHDDFLTLTGMYRCWNFEFRTMNTLELAFQLTWLFHINKEVSSEFITKLLLSP